MRKVNLAGGLTAALAALVVLAAGPAPARAQGVGSRSQAGPFASTWEVDGRLGLSFPFGGLGDLENPGLAANLGGAYWFRPRLAVRADWGLEAFSGNSIPSGPDFRNLDLWHYTVGLETSLASPVPGNVRLTVNGGLGATTLDFAGSGPTHTYFSLTGGGRIAVPIGRQVDAFGGLQLNLAFTSSNDLFERRQNLALEETLGTSSAWSLPIWGGLQVHFP